jgi:hypothetical protein
MKLFVIVEVVVNFTLSHVEIIRYSHLLLEDNVTLAVDLAFDRFIIILKIKVVVVV